MFDKLKTATTRVATGLGGLQDLAAEQLQGTMNEVNASVPYLARVGYCLLNLQVEIGLSPKVILALSQRETIDPAAFASILAEVSERKVLASILSALQQANALQGKFRVQGYFFRDIEIELGIPPAVRMIFVGAEVVIPTTPVPALVPSPTIEEQIEDPAAIELPMEAPPEPAIAPEPPPLPPEPRADHDVTAMWLGLSPRSPEVAPDEPKVVRVEGDGLIRFRCTGCRVKYKVRATRAGEVLACHRCRELLIIPQPNGSPASA